MTLSKTEEEEVREKWNKLIDTYQLFSNENYGDNMPYDDQNDTTFNFILILLNNRETELIEKIKMEIVDLINNRSIEHGERLGIAMCLKLPSLQAPKEEI